MGTLASKAKIGVWVEAPGSFLWGSWGYYTQKKCLGLYIQNPSTQPSAFLDGKWLVMVSEMFS